MDWPPFTLYCVGGLRQGRYWHDRPPIQYKRKSDNAGQGADLVLSEQRATLESPSSALALAHVRAHLYMVTPQ